MAGGNMVPNGLDSAVHEEAPRQGVTTLRDFLRIAWRRKAVLVTCVMVVPLTAALVSIRQQKEFRADAYVLLTRASATSALQNLQSPSDITDAERDALTQESVALAQAIADATAKALATTDFQAADLADGGNVTAQDGADILKFSFTTEDPALAMRVVNEWANQYTLYRTQIDTTELGTAIADVTRQRGALDPTDPVNSATVSALDARLTQLEVARTLMTSRARVVNTAGETTQVAPTPVKDTLMGLALGLLLGFGLAFLIEALDTRVRAGEEIAERLGLQLLGRLPEPPKGVRSHDGLVMLEDPTSPHAEPFRLLRTNIEFGDLERRVQTILVTSAVESEGKSTTAANLAVAMARAGKRVCLVDLDLRRPYLGRFFGLVGAAGITDVALGHVGLGSALHSVEITGGGGALRPAAHVEPVLDVMPSGPLPPNPGEFAQSTTLAAIIAELRDRYDLVVIDSPPLLKVGDPLALSAHVDAILLVARMNVIRRPMATELRRLLGTTPTRLLGVVLTGAEADEAYGYGGYAYGYGDKPKAEARVR